MARRPETPEEPHDPRREGAAARKRYLGTALIGVAILLYWSARAIASWWRG